MKTLTTAEEQVMQILWDLKTAMVKDIIAKMQEPKPAYNTVSTVVRVLEKKGFIDHKAYGKTHLYFAKIRKKDYAKTQVSSLLKGYFNNSFPKLASFFAEENNIDINELEEILQEIKRSEK